MSPSTQKLLALLKTGIFTIFVPGTVAFYVPLRLVGAERHWRDWPSASWQFFGIPLLFFGICVYLWCAWDFAVTGLGTPAPIDAPRVLVVKGLYRFVRNPMYVGVLSTILGWAIWFASRRTLIYLAGVWLAFHLFVLLFEEPVLRGKFGPSYEDYCRRVHRWLPRFPREA